MEERLSLLGLSFAEWREERDIWMWREEVSYYWSFRGLPTGKGREGGDQMCESVQGEERKVLPSVKGRKEGIRGVNMKAFERRKEIYLPGKTRKEWTKMWKRKVFNVRKGSDLSTGKQGNKGNRKCNAKESVLGEEQKKSLIQICFHCRPKQVRFSAIVFKDFETESHHQ